MTQSTGVKQIMKKELSFMFLQKKSLNLTNKFQLRSKVRNDPRHKHIKHLAVYQLIKGDYHLSEFGKLTVLALALCQNRYSKIPGKCSGLTQLHLKESCDGFRILKSVAQLFQVCCL